jgi:AcrR family transcriptional regulator
VSGGASQRERLLDAAVRSFAARGIAATSLRSLAHQTEVTPAMLHYYFGRKEKLCEAVFQERIMPAVGMLQRRIEASTEAKPLAPIRTFVEGIHEMVTEHPWLPGLWVREVLTEGGKLRHDFVENIAPLVSLPLIQSLTEAQRRGSLNAALDPRLLFVSLLGLTMFPLAAAPIWRPGLAAADVDSATLLQHTISLLEDGVQPTHGK